MTDRRKFLTSLIGTATGIGVGLRGARYHGSEHAPRDPDHVEPVWEESVSFEGIHNVAEYGAVGNGKVDDSGAIQAAVNEAASRPGRQGVVWFPAGSYLLARSVDLRGAYVSLIGEGPRAVDLRADPNAGLDRIIDAREASDVARTWGRWTGFTVTGSDTPELIGIDYRNRHHTVFEQLRVRHCAIGVQTENDWLSHWRECLMDRNHVGMRLLGGGGSKHFLRCGFNTNSCRQVELLRQSDGQSGVHFDTCDFEFASGEGLLLDSGHTVHLTECYSEGLRSPLLRVRSGRVVVRGGYWKYHDSHEAALVVPEGGSVTIREAFVTVGEGGTIAQMVNEAGKGTIRLIDNALAMPESGVPTWPGDVLGYAPGPPTFNGSHLGRSFSVGRHSARVRSGEEGNAKIVTALEAGRVELEIRLKPAWRKGERLLLIVVYQSDTRLTVSLVAEEDADEPERNIAALKSTNGVDTSQPSTTAFKLDSNWGQGDFDRLVISSEVEAGHQVRLSELYVTDYAPMRGSLFKLR